MYKIYKIIAVHIILLFCSNISFAEISYVEINSKGKGTSYDDALKKALKEAVMKAMKGGLTNRDFDKVIPWLERQHDLANFWPLVGPPEANKNPKM